MTDTATPATGITTRLNSVGLIALERQRQIEGEGWDEAHDDEFSNGELAMAAASYAIRANDSINLPERDRRSAPAAWPWDEKYWKPAPRIRMLVKAGALIAAEIDRLLRAEGITNRPTPKGEKPMSVLRPWVSTLTMMQQTVLMTAVRGPDGLPKDHVSKLLLRWLRRCILFSAMDKREMLTPCEDGGGSFTGPSINKKLVAIFDDGPRWQPLMQEIVTEYLRRVDEMPHHFQLHFMHAAEILGYKYPESTIRAFWNRTYLQIVNDAHLQPESEERMDWRLGDNREQWLAAEGWKPSEPHE